MPLDIRIAKRADTGLLIDFIRALARHEGRPEAATADEDGLADLLFGPKALAKAFVGYDEGKAAAYAIVAERFSSFRATRSLYIEDMLVLDQHRGRGFGRELFTFIVNMALMQGYAALEWSALESNDIAIGFYDHIRAKRETGVLHFSMSKQHMKQLTVNDRD